MGCLAISPDQIVTKRSKAAAGVGSMVFPPDAMPCHSSKNAMISRHGPR